jgi:hypothetical protein
MAKLDLPPGITVTGLTLNPLKGPDGKRTVFVTFTCDDTQAGERLLDALDEGSPQ